MNLLSLSKGLSAMMNGITSLESVNRDILKNQYFKDFIDNLNAEQVIYLTFLTWGSVEKEDLNLIMSQMKGNLFLFSLIEFEDSDPSVECENCSGNGNIDCDNCYGSGERDCDECAGSGKIDCSDCDGDGKDEEGDECSTCDGSGKEDCDECGGSGNEECRYCDGSGNEECENCDGSGEITAYDHTPYTINYYVSYDNELKNFIESKLIRKRKPFDFNKNEKTFLLYSEDFGADSDDTEGIKEKYANNTYLLEFEDCCVNNQFRRSGPVYKPLFDDDVSIFK